MPAAEISTGLFFEAGVAAADQAIGFSSIRKSYDLFAKPWIPCR